MPLRGLMRYYPSFPMVIPLIWADCSRVTHPSATLIPRRVLTFDLHVLSMPPAFILSQNQTLKFNCLKSLPFFSKVITALTLLSLCWLCFLGYYKFNFSTLKKLTEITFHLLVCQIKSHFFLIPFLIFWNRTTVRADHFRGDSLYIIPQPVCPCQAFFRTF